MTRPEGPLDASGLRIAIVAAAFNSEITQRLVDGALDALRERGAPEGSVPLCWVPGAYELPLACRTLATTGTVDAIIALGCVIRGETPHFEFVAGEAARGLMTTQLETGVPIAFGILTTDDTEQAEARAGGPGGNKGAEAAWVAVEQARLLDRLRNPR